MPSRRLALRVPILLALLLGTTTAWAASPPASAKEAAACTTPNCRYAKGLLWKIERPGQNPAQKPSYLFGTIHIADPRVTNLPASVQQIFDAAQSFTMELIFDGDGLLHMAETMFFNDSRTLEGVIGATRFAEVQKAFSARGVPTGDLNRKKPWVIAMLLSTPPQQGVPLDLQLQLRATLQNKPTHGLENMREQIAVFNDMSMDDQVAILDSTLREYREADKLLEAMVQAYVARDLMRIMGMMGAPTERDRLLYESVTERLLVNRNARMLERMRPRLDEGNAFIAVGAAHLAGERGLLYLLEKSGYRVTPVY